LQQNGGEIARSLVKHVIRSIFTGNVVSRPKEQLRQLDITFGQFKRALKKTFMFG